MTCKNVLKIGRLIALGLIGLLLLICFLFAAAQTKWTQKQICAALVKNAQAKGLRLSIGSIEGKLPFRWTMKDIELQLSPSDFISIKALKVRISPLALMRKEIAIAYLSLQDTTYTFARGVRPPALPSLPSSMSNLHSKLTLFWLPFSLSIRSLKVPSLLIENSLTREKALFSITGKARLKKDVRDFLLNLKINGPPNFTSSAELFLKGNKRNHYAAGELKLQMKSIEALRPFASWPLETDFYMVTSLEGPWHTWSELLAPSGSDIETSPIQGLFMVKLNRLDVPVLQKFDKKCKLESIFSVSQYYDLAISKFLLDSDLLQIKGKADLGPDFELRGATCTFNLSELSILNAGLPFQLQGSVAGQGKYDGRLASLAIASKDLKIENTAFQAFNCDLNARFQDRKWQGELKLEADHPDLPIRGHSDFTFEPKAYLTITDFIIQAPEAQISGNFNYLPVSQNLDGAFFAQILQLSRFQELVPNAVIEGSVGIEGRISSFKIEQPQVSEQKIDLYATIKNLRYRDIYITDANVNAEIIDPLSTPTGTLTIQADKAYIPNLFISTIYAKLALDEQSWPFDVSATGMWKDEFSFQTAGVLSKRDQNFSLAVSDLIGSAMGKPFSLEKPFSAGWNAEQWHLDDCDFKIDDGHFHATVDFNKAAAHAAIKADHFPLDFLTLVLPHLSLKGSSSVDIFLDASAQNIQGQLNILLEQADIYQQGKTESLFAKGGIRVGLEQNVLQMHANLSATGGQFLDLAATFPICHCLDPFQIKFDQKKPVSSELTMEGKLEEIFDFINIGTHQATGLLSCHLFLSKNLASPAINGQIELQSGTYDNYFTGTSLKDINALAEAENNKIKLEYLTARDDHNGKVMAKGNLFLSPAAKFPFSIQADLSNLNFVRSELVKSNFTGELEISGTSASALAQGALTVSQATFQIPDEIPFEIPVLPITYVNPPPHLKASFVQVPAIYPFQLDLNLDAPGKIFVKGKGLDSEWHGNIQLSGTNTAFAGDGVLKLISGKFVFAGKTFTLGKGEITFSDKPTASAIISLSGTLPMQNITITAFVRGPLTAPILTFQSMPQMPTSSLLSYILFDKDISEINYFQAFQLAQVVMSLAGGGGPGVLEKIRKTLGIDRLGIVAGPEGFKQMQLQIGKYLTKGVLITLAQGAETSQVVVEVTLKEGFVFQAETEEQNSGKFILKWHKNY